MLKAGQLTDLSKASPEDQETIWWVLSRMQLELESYMRQGFGEPGPVETHGLAAHKVQTYIKSLFRELDLTSP